jgi:hypothetical protein
MNPISVISGIASILGIGSSLVSQGTIIHRELHPPYQQQAQVQQQQQCVPPGKLEVVLLANGQRQLVCVEDQNVK